MRILVVEEKKAMSDFIKHGLEEKQHEVFTASDGEEGYQLALEQQFKLIVLDWMSPKKDAMSLVRDLRGKSDMTPVLMLAARDSVEDIVSGLDSSSVDYLTKPFVFAELLARMTSLLRRSESQRGAEIRYGGLRLDPVTHRVWRAEKEIELSAREYRLLEFFMRNPGQIVTRSMISEQAWDCEFENCTNVIEVYINYLRNKIDRRADKKLIHTVRGMGYIFREEEAPASPRVRPSRGNALLAGPRRRCAVNAS